MKNMIENPALKKFTSQMRSEVVLAQVLIRRNNSGYEVQHVEERDAHGESLRAMQPADARSLAQFTATGEFRPLKAAPNLPKGWHIQAANDTELELALNGLYPGALADWLAAKTSNPPVTDYRSFAARQSGMYRITAKLTDAQAAAVIRECCDAKHCLKCRLWTVDGLKWDDAARKSLVPCLEPCAVLLESARKAARAAQEVACANADMD